MLRYATLCQVDEDKVVNMREKTMSGLIIGSSAFFTKPGETIAPMLGWFLIHHAHGASGSAGEGLAGAAGGSRVALADIHDIDKNLLFRVLVLGPFVIAIIQVCVCVCVCV